MNAINVLTSIKQQQQKKNIKNHNEYKT